MDARSLQENCGYNFTAPADCPPETGGTRSEATEGVDKTNHRSLLSNYLSTPSPLRGTHPCPRGRKWMLGYFRNTKSPFSCCNYSPLLQRVRERVRPFIFHLSSVICHLYSVLCHLSSVICTLYSISNTKSPRKVLAFSLGISVLMLK